MWLFLFSFYLHRSLNLNANIFYKFSEPYFSEIREVKKKLLENTGGKIQGTVQNVNPQRRSFFLLQKST